MISTTMPRSYAQRLVLRDLLRHGYYHSYLRNWKARYGDRVQVYLFEEMAADPRAFMQRLAQRLDIDPDYYATAPCWGWRTARCGSAVQLVHRLYRRLRRQVGWLRALPMFSVCHPVLPIVSMSIH
jgi:hypothetical protein